ncbi:hypothetical protein Tco_0832344 [Tanacetum coccineum]
MPRATVGDTSLTRSYIPKVSQTPSISPSIAHFYKSIENRCIHEGEVVDQLYYTFDYIDRCLSNIRLNCLYKINEPIVPRFILDFYSQVTLQRDDSGVILISFMIQNEFITSNNLVKSSEFHSLVKPYSQMNGILALLHTPKRPKDHIISTFPLLKKCINFFNFNVLTLTVSSKTKASFLHQIKIESARATPKAHLSYGMFLTRLFRYVMEHYPHLDNGIYNVVDHVMRPLTLRQTRRPRSDRGKARHSVSSTFTHHNRGSSSHQGDDDEDDGASRASTPSPATYLNSLKPLNYQRYDIPSPSEQTDDLLFERQPELLNQTQEIHKEVRGGFKSFGKALRGVFEKEKK